VPDTCISYYIAKFKYSLGVTCDSHRCDYNLGPYSFLVVLWRLVEVFREPNAWMGVGVVDSFWHSIFLETIIGIS